MIETQVDGKALEDKAARKASYINMFLPWRPSPAATIPPQVSQLL